MQNNFSSILVYLFKECTVLFVVCLCMHSKVLEEYIVNSVDVFLLLLVSETALACLCNICILNWTYIIFVVRKKVF